MVARQLIKAGSFIFLVVLIRSYRVAEPKERVLCIGTSLPPTGGWQHPTQVSLLLTHLSASSHLFGAHYHGCFSVWRYRLASFPCLTATIGSLGNHWCVPILHHRLTPMLNVEVLQLAHEFENLSLFLTLFFIHKALLGIYHLLIRRTASGRFTLPPQNALSDDNRLPR